MSLEIINAKQISPEDFDIRRIAEIECNPEVKKWLTIHVEHDVEKEYQEYKRFFRELPLNPDVEVLIAKYDGQVAGFIVLWKLGIGMKPTASIGISVHPDYWKKGIATQLMKSAIEISREKGFQRLEIETMAENMAMRRVAEKLGFKLETVRKNSIKKNGSYHDEVVYYLLL
ncbi:MAG: GNAT family N-acetyltransferase [Candidatus Bathyarchaeia archaeon]